MKHKFIFYTITEFVFCMASDIKDGGQNKLQLRRPKPINVGNLKPVEEDEDCSGSWCFGASQESQLESDKEIFERNLKQELKGFFPLFCNSVNALELLWAKWSRRRCLDQEGSNSCLELRMSWVDLNDTDQKFRAIILLKYASCHYQTSTIVKTLISSMEYNFKRQFPDEFESYSKKYKLPTPAVRTGVSV